MISLASLINSNEHAIKYGEILELVVATNILSPEEIEMIDQLIEQNMDWQNKYYKALESWLNGEEPTESSTAPTATSTLQPGESSTNFETTTLGAGSLIASFAVVVACATVKFFI